VIFSGDFGYGDSIVCGGCCGGDGTGDFFKEARNAAKISVSLVSYSGV
jgi:hypothetical protein